MKVTHEERYDGVTPPADQKSPPREPPAAALRDRHTRKEEDNGVAISVGTGVDYRLNAALALRIAGIEYSRSSVAKVGGLPYSNGLQFTTGMVLRLGTW